MTQVLITLLAEEPSTTGPEFGKASPVGLLVVVLLMIGMFVLVWSMNRHLKNIPQSFDNPEPEQPSGANAEPIDSDPGESPREPSG